MATIEEFVAGVFAKYDSAADGTGSLNADELREFYNELAAKRADLGLSADGYQAWHASVAVDGDGTVNPEELVAYLKTINF